MSSIDLSNVDLDALTVENFRDLTGKRLRVPKILARCIRNSKTYIKAINEGEVIAEDELITTEEARRLHVFDLVESERRRRNGDSTSP